MRARTSRAAALALVLTVSVAGQCPQISATPFAGLPAALSVDDASGGPLVQLKCEGFATSPPTAWPSGAAPPHFDLDAVFRACGVPTGPLPDIDALSLGDDWILADDNTGRVRVPPGRWAGITFSVRRGSTGAPGSPVFLETATGSAEADVFFWILPGSRMPAPLVGVPRRALDAGELGFKTVPEIDALDHFAPLYMLDPVLRSPALGLVEPMPTVFFSVSNATLARVPKAWWSGTPPSGATILRTHWDGSSWSCPVPWRLPAGLGLGPEEDIDALALDRRTRRVLFSTDTPNRNEILFLSLRNDSTTPLVYSDQQGDPVSDEIGLLNSDEVDAICALDPSTAVFDQGLLGSNPMRVAYGTPIEPLAFPGVPRTLEATAFLACWHGGPAELKSYALGRAPGASANSVYGALLHIPGGGPLVGLGTFPFSVSGFCGSPAELTIPLPPALRLRNPSLRVDVVWVAADGALTTLVQAYPVTITL